MSHDELSQKTRLIRAGAKAEARVKTVNPPLQRGSTVLVPNARALYERHDTYGRLGLSMQTALADAIAELDGARGSRLFPSGLAASTSVLLALLKGGDEILVADCIYGPTRRFCDGLLKSYGIATRGFSGAADPEDVLALAGPATRMILLESPGSLTFEIQDIPAIAKLARERNIITAIDNTWGAGLLFDALGHGVDVSIQALTKYVGGHSDVFMGSASTNDPAILTQLDRFLREAGLSVGPDDAYLMLRGLRTLDVRLERHGSNALKIAGWLAEQPQVKRVLCPGLPGAPGYELWKRDFKGLNGLFGVVLQPGPPAAVEAFIDALQIFGLGFSWGGFESLAIHCDPQLKSRPARPDQGGPLVRLHVGLEEAEDLIADLDQALAVYASRL
ncbi:MAG TPA: cystathionine beta-lyase [Caulobacteraceae bacterium]|nr:cystathionine beta-lyase [Caulobacteraceae bacterium]